VVHQTVSGAPGWHLRSCCSRDFVGGVRLKITGLSGGAPDCPVSQQSAGLTVGRGIRARRVASANGRMGHRTVRCAPDSVRCARLASANLLLSGLRRRRTAKNHRTVRARGIRARRVTSANGRMGHRTVRCAQDSVRCANGSQVPTVGFAK
jgi:hypothetical protein